MTVVSVSAQNTRLDDAESNTQWVSDGGGAGGALETDFFFQNANCFARKGGSAQRGIGMSDNVNTDMTTATGTYQTWMVKYIVTTPGLLDSLATQGAILEIGSGSAASRSTARYEYYVQGNDTYPVDKSWLILPIDPNIASHRDNTVGSPGLTIVDWFGFQVDQSGVSKSPNYALDAIDVGAGLTLIGGDGADPDGSWQSLSDADWGTAANRYGYVRENEGVFLIYGHMIIGTATATVFTDSNQTVIFPDGLFAAGFTTVTCDIQNATSAIAMTSITYLGAGTAAGEDTRPLWIVTGTSGTFTATTCTFTDFASMVLTSGASLQSCTLTVDDLTQSSADIEGCIVNTVTASQVAVMDDPTFGTTTGLNNTDFVQAGSGHAIEITTTGTHDFENLGFSGYGGTPGSNLVASSGANDAAIFNSSGGAVTINVNSGGDTPSVRNAASSTTTVQNSVSVTLTDLIVGSQVYIFETATPANVIMDRIASNTTETVTFAYLSDTAITIDVRQSSFSPKYLPFKATGTILSTGFSLSIGQQLDTIADPTTGFVFLGTTNAGDSSATSITVDKPSDVAEDDFLIAGINHSSTSAGTPTAPAGWTEIQTALADSGPGSTTWMYYKVAGASEGANYQWTAFNSGHIVASIMAIRNVNTATPVDVSNRDAVGNPNSVSATTTVENAFLVGFGGFDGSATHTFSSTDYEDERLDLSFSANGDMAIAWFTSQDAGASGLKTRTIESTKSGAIAAWIVALEAP